MTDRWTRNDLAKGLAMLDGVTLVDVRATVGDPKDATDWREYLGRADDLMAHLSAALAAAEPSETVCCGKPVQEGSPEGYTWECCGNHITPTPKGAVEALTYDEVEAIILKTETPDLSDRGDKIWTRRMAVALANLFNARLAALALPAAEVKVKPLQWREHPDAFPAPTWSAQVPFGFYNIEEISASDCPAYEVRLHAHHLVAVKDDLSDAKVAAQADYEARILSALAAPSQAREGE